ncbi:MAG: LamG domain-containing protein, partial [Ignavibacteria bacterium]|nr:LamG domain-containing protein [Ignavibacteria bacterium]
MKKLILALFCFACYSESMAQIPFQDLVLGMQFGGNFLDVSATQAILSENTALLTTDRNGLGNNAGLLEGNQKINFDFSNNVSLLAGAENGQITFSCRIQLDSNWLNNLALNTEFNLLNNGKSYLRMEKGALNNVLILKGGVFNSNTIQGTNGFLETSLILRNTANGNLPDWNGAGADWINFTLSYDSNFGVPIVGLFVNGILKASSSVTYNTTTLTYNNASEKFEIGSSTFLTQGFKGKIDDVYLYNRSLTLNEIVALDTVNISTGIDNKTESSFRLGYTNLFSDLPKIFLIWESKLKTGKRTPRMKCVEK